MNVSWWKTGGNLTNCAWGIDANVPTSSITSASNVGDYPQRFPPEAMSANTTSLNYVYGAGNYVTTVSAEFTGRNGFYALDYNNTSVWQPQTTNITYTSNEWVTFTLPIPAKLISYSINSGATGTLNGRMARSWNIYGVNGTTSNLLHSVNRGAWATNETATYSNTVDSNTTFTAFKYQQTSNAPANMNVPVLYYMCKF